MKSSLFFYPLLTLFILSISSLITPAYANWGLSGPHPGNRNVGLTNTKRCNMTTSLAGLNGRYSIFPLGSVACEFRIVSNWGGQVNILLEDNVIQQAEIAVNFTGNVNITATVPSFFIGNGTFEFRYSTNNNRTLYQCFDFISEMPPTTTTTSTTTTTTTTTSSGAQFNYSLLLFVSFALLVLFV